MIVPPPPTPVEGTPVVPPVASSERIVVRSDGGAATFRARFGRPRRIGGVMSLFGALALVATGGGLALRARAAADPGARAPIAIAPAVVVAVLRLDGALVRGAARNWALKRTGPLRYGDPVPVQLTAYCLKGTTRRDNYVRQGIVAADPKLFPLGRFLELYVGRKYVGRFLVDDTGSAIHNAILDIWTPTCREARLFGRQHGTAVLVPRPKGASPDTLMTGRLGGVATR